MNLHSRWFSTRWDCQPVGKYCSYETPCCRRGSARHLSCWRGVSQGTGDTWSDHTAAVWVEADPGCRSPDKWDIPAPPEPNLDLKMLVWPWCLQGRRKVMSVCLMCITLSYNTKKKKLKFTKIVTILYIMCIKNAKSTWSILMSPLAYIETFLWTEVKRISPDYSPDLFTGTVWALIDQKWSLASLKFLLNMQAVVSFIFVLMQIEMLFFLTYLFKSQFICSSSLKQPQLVDGHCLFVCLFCFFHHHHHISILITNTYNGIIDIGIMLIYIYTW